MSWYNGIAPSWLPPPSHAQVAGLPNVWGARYCFMWEVGPQDAVGLVASWRLRNELWLEMPFELRYWGITAANRTRHTLGQVQ